MSFIKVIRQGSTCCVKIWGIPFLKFKYINKQQKSFSSSIIQSLKSCGKNVIIANDALIYHPEHMKIGNNVHIGNRAHIFAGGEIEIGNNVVFGPGVTIWTANHNYNYAKALPYDETVTLKSVTIEDNVWIGGGIHHFTRGCNSRGSCHWHGSCCDARSAKRSRGWREPCQDYKVQGLEALRGA